jgi:hypothetical protein
MDDSTWGHLQDAALTLLGMATTYQRGGCTIGQAIPPTPRCFFCACTALTAARVLEGKKTCFEPNWQVFGEVVQQIDKPEPRPSDRPPGSPPSSSLSTTLSICLDGQLAQEVPVFLFFSSIFRLLAVNQALPRFPNPANRIAGSHREPGTLYPPEPLVVVIVKPITDQNPTTLRPPCRPLKIMSPRSSYSAQAMP